MSSKQDLILDAALELFTEKGFSATPTSLIAKTAGVATGTLFHYFKSKEELINELFIKCKSSFADVLKQGLADYDEQTNLESFKAVLRNMHHTAVFWGIENKKKFLFFQMYSHSPYITQSTKERSHKMYEPLREHLLKGQELNFIRKIEPELFFGLSAGIFVSTVYYVFYHCDLEDKEKIKEVIDNSFDFYFNGFKV